MTVEGIGKIIKSSKKKYTWDVRIDAKAFLIEYIRSSMSGKDKIFVNGTLVYNNQERFRKPLNVSFDAEDNKFSIIEYGEIFKLFINSKDFDEYFGHDRVKSILKKSELEDEREKGLSQRSGQVNINAHYVQQLGEHHHHGHHPDKCKRKSNKKVTFNMTASQEEHEMIKHGGPTPNYHSLSNPYTTTPYGTQMSYSSHVSEPVHQTQHPNVEDNIPIYQSGQLFSSMVDDKYQHGVPVATNMQPASRFGSAQPVYQDQKDSRINPLKASDRSINEVDLKKQAMAGPQHTSGPYNVKSTIHASQQDHHKSNPPLVPGLAAQAYSPPGFKKQTTFDSVESSNSNSQIPQTLDFSRHSTKTIPEFPLPGALHDLSYRGSFQQPQISNSGNGTPHRQSLTDYLNKQIPEGNSMANPSTNSHGIGNIAATNATAFASTGNTSHPSGFSKQPVPQQMIHQHSTHPPSRLMRREGGTDQVSLEQAMAGLSMGSTKNTSEMGQQAPVKVSSNLGTTHASQHVGQQAGAQPTLSRTSVDNGRVAFSQTNVSAPAQSQASPHDKPAIQYQQANPLSRGLGFNGQSAQTAQPPHQTGGLHTAAGLGQGYRQ